MNISVSEDLEKADATKLERTKFQNWMLITSAVRERVKKSGELRLDEVPSRSFMLRKSEFPASTVRGAISLDGQRVDVHWQVREGINGLVEEASATFGLRLSESASLYFTREGRVSFGGVEQAHCFARDQVLNAVGISENAREKSSNLRVF